MAYMKEAVESLRMRLVIVDGYAFSLGYLSLLRTIVKVCSIDDFCREDNPADVIVNYNIHAIGGYQQFGTDKARRLLLGPWYAPLRGEFQSFIPREPAEAVMDILVTTGGTDPLDFLGNFLSEAETAKEFGGIRFHAVIGPYALETHRLRGPGLRQGIVLHRNVSSMSSLMGSCDMAVSAGGSTLYELCRCGLPTVSISFADNQLPVVEGFHGMGVIPYCGDVRHDMHGTIRRCIARLVDYLHDYPKRSRISHEMRTLVDGGGAKRIAAELASLLAGDE